MAPTTWALSWMPACGGNVHKLPLFREAFAKRRALIPATGFFEWQLAPDGGKQPWRFVRADEEPFALAGLWEFARIAGEEIRSSTIIVGEPNPVVGGVHDRMPVMLMPEDYDRWLDPAMSVDELRAMLQPYDPGLMKACEVSRVVNSVKNDTPECVEARVGERHRGATRNTRQRVSRARARFSRGFRWPI